MQTERETMRKYLVEKADKLAERIEGLQECTSKLEEELRVIRMIWKLV